MDPFDTAKDILGLGHWEQPPPYQEVRVALRALDRTSVQALVAEGLAEHDRQRQGAAPPEPWLHGPDDRGLDLVLWVAQVRPDACGGLPAKLWHRQIFGHGVLYRGADPDTRDALVAACDSAIDAILESFGDLAALPLEWGDPSLDPTIRRRLHELTAGQKWRQLNVAVRMLAWIGDEVVQNWFHVRRTTLPNWPSLFYLSVDDYASQGGWELTSEGKRRDLTFATAYQLSSEEEGNRTDAVTSKGPVAVMTSHEDRCRWCGRWLTTMLDLDLRNPALNFLKLNGTRLRLVMCEECSLWNRLFMDVDLAGGARWSVLNEATGYLIPGDRGDMLFTPPSQLLALGPICSSDVEVAAQGVMCDVSQLGGLPSWIQDAEYVPCPTCQHMMTFVGQVSPDAITARAIDGVLYGLLCPTCLHSTVTYQCT